MTSVPSWMSSGQILSSDGLFASSNAYSQPQSPQPAQYALPPLENSQPGSHDQGGAPLHSAFRCTCLDNDSDSDEELPDQGGASLPQEKKERKERLGLRLRSELEIKSCSYSPMRGQHEWEEQRRREQDVLSPFSSFEAEIETELEEMGEQYFLMPVRQVLPEERTCRHRR